MSSIDADSLAVAVGRWRTAAMSTAPVDLEACRNTACDVYRAAGLRPPSEVILCGGPQSMVRAWHRTGSRRRVGANVKSVFDEMLVKAAAGARQRAGASLPRLPYRNGAITDLGEAVIEMVVEEARYIGPTIGDRFSRLFRRPNAGEHYDLLDLRYHAFSQHAVSWFPAIECSLQAFPGSPEAEAIRSLMSLVGAAGFVMPHEDVCFLSERHDALHFDDLDRLHRSDGPALSYPDGWALHAWKGVQIPSWLVEPGRGNISIAAVDREQNHRVRRCMIDIMTPERFIRNGGARVHSRDETGVLWQRAWARGDIWAAVEVVNGTPEPDGSRRRYFLQVPGEMETARSAVAWTYGLSDTQYAGLMLRT